ncbi:MFS transporter [Nocardia stercoris]|uniref:MFS transporter n=1 Tax=Nocardia stercoris TaxID=2483361 RepID=A0A3M2KSR5_9NOCA|nr:MFS transporter [Nocardia stercoris]RMI28712.1 MFS transporter [Nocardia stercoris]
MDTTHPPETGAVQTLSRRHWIAFGVVLVAGFMDLLDVTIVNVAAPSIQRELNAAYSQLEWVVAAYVLAFAATLITGGRLGDIYGRRPVFLSGITLFTAASAACGLAANPDLLIGARFVQGIAAGLMVPQLLATISATFPADKQSRAIAIYSGVGGSASAVGLSLGGLLVQWDLFGLSWRPIFLVNIPVGIAAVVVAFFVLPNSRSATAQRLDPIGMVLAVSAVLLLAYPLTEGRRLGWPTWTFAMMLGAAGVFAVFVLYELRRARTVGSPLVEPALFRSRSFAFGLAGWLLFWIGLGAFFLVWTLFMQSGLGWTPMRAGLTAVTFAVGAGVGAGTSLEQLTPRFGSRVIVGGVVVNAIGFGLYAAMAYRYGADFSSLMMIAPLLITGIGFGVVVAPTIDLLLAQVPRSEAGSASGLLNTGQQLGAALGVALVGVLFFAQLDHGSAHGVTAATPQIRAELSAAQVPAAVQEEILAGFAACVHDRSAAADPTVVPASCRVQPAGPGAGTVADILTRASRKANADNFSRTFGYTLCWEIGLLALVALGFLALPRDARPADRETASPTAEPALV